MFMHRKKLHPIMHPCYFSMYCMKCNRVYLIFTLSLKSTYHALTCIQAARAMSDNDKHSDHKTSKKQTKQTITRFNALRGAGGGGVIHHAYCKSEHLKRMHVPSKGMLVLTHMKCTHSIYIHVYNIQHQLFA